MLVEAFQELGVKWKPAPQEYESTKSGMIRIRVGGQDKRKEKFKGWVELEPFDREGTKGTFCLLKRDDVRFFHTYDLRFTDRFYPGKPYLMEATLESSD